MAAPETVTLALPTLMISKVLLLLLRLIVILPVPFWILSFKVITRFALTATAVALLAGFKLAIIGAVTSADVNCHVLLPAKPT